MLKPKFFRQNDRSQNMNVRLTKAEREKIQALADEFADGNLSAWMRYAAVNCKPLNRHLETKKAN